MIFQLDELNLVNGGIPYVKDGRWSLLKPGTATSVLAASSSGRDASSLAWQNPITPTQLGAGAVLTMPSKIYAVVGHETNVYFDNVIRTYARGTYVNTPINLYEFTVTCANGIQQVERWTYTPTALQTGSIPWSITVALNGQTLATASSTLVTSAAKAGGSVSRKVLVIGDSTSDIGSTWIPELVNLCNYNCTAPTLGGGADNLTITPIGTHSNTSADSGGTSRTWLAEGYAGATTAWHMGTAPLSTSPFVFSNAFNFGTYLSHNSLTMSSKDWVILNLGINDTVASVNPNWPWTVRQDVGNNPGPAYMISNYNAMIASIQAAVPGIRIGITVIIPPSAFQDSFNSYYTAGLTQALYRRNRDLFVEQLIATFDNQQSNGIYLCPINLGIDTVNSMITTTAAPNARSSATVTRGYHPVHPASPGYYQIADVVYSFLRAEES